MKRLSQEPREAIPVTVTFLEMLRQPSFYPRMPGNSEVALFAARDIPLHYYRYLMDRVGRKWHWVAMLRLSDEELETYLRTPGRDVRVLYLNGAPTGFFDLHAQAPDFVDLAYFGMMSEAIGLGLGRWFLGAAIQAAWSYEPKRVIVQTCTLDHPAALPLYQKLGFNPIGQTTSVIQPLSEAERAAAIFSK
ncbi:GNAT family N-acetyltransferase [Tianweitania sp. BSSL-BM11]|uniref:GNAT family N-acetyltransferase n=1 Tax=Tianweitania aestuarii TaxID=2814886 RepID=A0ABS5RTC4_9HYPH|nr:GNAT family N-acetyltransferase [Tianweitania aestuarii]MBS9720300.1 GNAT family N-acetyltransferase [Tianweitania aestuarii]